MSNSTTPSAPIQPRAKAAAKQQVVAPEPGKSKSGQRPQEAGVV